MTFFITESESDRSQIVQRAVGITFEMWDFVITYDNLSLALNHLSCHKDALHLFFTI